MHIQASFLSRSSYETFTRVGPSFSWFLSPFDSPLAVFDHFPAIWYNQTIRKQMGINKYFIY